MPPNTEMLHEKAKGLDDLPIEDVAGILAEGQIKAAESLRLAPMALAAGSRCMAETIGKGGVLYYVAAGSSGLMAASDAMELGGTFDIPSSQVSIIMAGGLPTSADMPGDTEDQSEELINGLANLQPKDTVIAVSASGSTPFTMEAMLIAQNRGAKVIGIANNIGCPLLEGADISILLPTPSEVISGSTRMGAGTAQKIALNIMSTLMAVELGHVYDGMMVSMRAENIKLRGRAMRMVCTIADVSEKVATDALSASGGDVKSAVLIAAGAGSAERSSALLKDAGGHLRPALQRLRANTQ